MNKNPTHVTHIVYEDAEGNVEVALRKVGRSQFLEVQAGSTGAVSIEIPLIFLEEAIAEFWEVCGEEPYGYGHGIPVYDRGYDDGYLTGHDDGYDDGYSSGREDGYEDGTAAGAEAGLVEGYADGYAKGYDDGCAVGYYTDRQDERDGVGRD